MPNMKLTYNTYTADETRESVEAKFFARFGLYPRALFQDEKTGEWKAGPVILFESESHEQANPNPSVE